jgi:segregation and condensation protein B
MDLAGRVEGVLFYRAAPMKFAALARFFEVSEEEIIAACRTLAERRAEDAVRLVMTDADAELTTAPELASTIEALRKDDLRRDIGKAGAETLAIVLYRGPISRAAIDRIRGVNSTFILRNLLIRGLVERRDHPRDQRSFLYAATPALFEHLGITAKERLPEYQQVLNELDAYEAAQQAATPAGTPQADA